MSYSFNVKADSKADALVKVAEKMSDVVAQQPVHVVDAATAKDAVKLMADLLEEEADKEFYIAVNGSASTVDGRVVSLNLGIYVSQMPKTVA